MFGETLENVRTRKPLIHNITNYVTVNDCANVLLACGGSPVMADDESEVCEITSGCDGLVINIGTLNRRTIGAMFAAGRKSNEAGHPVVLDPVGAGASKMRTDTARELIKEIHFSVIRANISEIRSLFTGTYSTRGVDAAACDKVTEDNLNESVKLIKEIAQETGCIISVSGAIDIVADRETAYCIRNGNAEMSRVTGTGCQLSALTAAFTAANPGNELEAAAGAVCAMGVCGETALKRMTSLDGNMTFRNYIIDAVYNLTPEELNRSARYEIR